MMGCKFAAMFAVWVAAKKVSYFPATQEQQMLDGGETV